MNIVRLLLHKYRTIRYPEYRQKHALDKEYRKLLTYPRYQSGTFELMGKLVKFVDGPSCHFIHKEIFKEEIYRFEATTDKPFIIDAGANIGLGVLYFKKIYPQAEILAFEPDKTVSNVLLENIRTFSFSNVTVIDKALWNENTTLRFHSEGADAGRVSTGSDSENVIEVHAVRLRPYLQQRRVDFLKMDIEGAETTVLKDCADLLGNVDRIFVEYHSFVGKEQSLPELLALLKDSGFRLSISSPGLSSKSPFMKRDTYAGMDMQLNIYGFRN
ncbi:FkbM family methyltransferase [Chryseolinea serpens]|nr:FkbM family methyltransferase [Chryseolinea serpens]